MEELTTLCVGYFESKQLFCTKKPLTEKSISSKYPNADKAPVEVELKNKNIGGKKGESKLWPSRKQLQISSTYI